MLQKSSSASIGRHNVRADPIWTQIRAEAAADAELEPLLASFLHATILNHDTLEGALSMQLADKLGSTTLPPIMLREIIELAFANDPRIGQSVRADLNAVSDRDPACDQLSMPLLYFKGFHAIQAYRVANWLWRNDRRPLALFLQNRMNTVFAFDAHPAARIGQGIMVDHATGVVIGETAVIGDNVSMLHGVTLGGTGKTTGDRHPKIGNGVLIGAAATVLGNVRIGENAKIGAGSVVLKDVPDGCTVAGVPAVPIGGPCFESRPALEMDHHIDSN